MAQEIFSQAHHGTKNWRQGQKSEPGFGFNLWYRFWHVCRGL